MFTRAFPAFGFSASILRNIHAGKSRNKAFFSATFGFSPFGLAETPKQSRKFGLLSAFPQCSCGFCACRNNKSGKSTMEKSYA